MAKLKLDPNPTFDASVNVPVPGSDPVPVRFTFKHRSRSACMEWFKAAADKSDVDILLDVASGWELDDAFTRENVERLCDNYAGTGFAVMDVYLKELRGERVKN